MSICRMGESGLVRTGNKVFPRPGPYFSVYEVIFYKCCS